MAKRGSIAICWGCEEEKKIKTRGLCSQCYRKVRQKRGICISCNKEKNLYMKNHCELCYKKKAGKIITCEICGEEKPHYAKGFCYRCYTFKHNHPDFFDTASQQEIELLLKNWKRIDRGEKGHRIIICKKCRKEAKHEGKGLCTKCYKKEYYSPEAKKQRLKEETCNILSRHDEDFEDDPDALDRTFMAELIEIDCDWDEVDIAEFAKKKEDK